jgi:hypothetical protein
MRFVPFERKTLDILIEIVLPRGKFAPRAPAEILASPNGEGAVVVFVAARADKILGCPTSKRSHISATAPLA